MAHESFEDPVTAALMNDHLAAIRVDREERPDGDAVYMTATQAMTGHDDSAGSRNPGVAWWRNAKVRRLRVRGRKIIRGDEPRDLCLQVIPHDVLRVTMVWACPLLLICDEWAKGTP
jgi:Protein of unknown function, DUF255